MLRRFVLWAVVGLAMLVAIPAAQAVEPNVGMSASVSPTNGGKPSAPKNAKIKTQFQVDSSAAVTINQVTYFVPQNVSLDGTGFGFCTAAQILADGVSSCPKTSKVGKGSATFVIGTSRSSFAITVFAAGPASVALAFQGAVSTAATGFISAAGAPFGQKITIPIPLQLQSSANVFFHFTSMTLEIGAAVEDEDGSGPYFASLTGCPADRTHDFGVSLNFTPNPDPPVQSNAMAVALSRCS